MFKQFQNNILFQVHNNNIKDLFLTLLMLDKCKWEIFLNMEELIIIEKLKFTQLLGVLLFPLKIKLVIIIKYKNPKQMDLQDLKNSQEKELKEE